MKQAQFTAADYEGLKEGLQQIRRENDVSTFSNVLFHVLTGTLDEDSIRLSMEAITSEFPDAHIIGCSTGGNIVNGQYTFDTFAVSCLMFESPETRVEVLQVPLPECPGHEAVSGIMDELGRRPWVKGVEMLATVRGLNMTGVLETLSGAKQDVQIFGGGALSCNYMSNETCIFSRNDGVLRRGLVFVFYGGPALSLSTSYITGWKPLGSALEITASDGFLLRELDHRPAFETYRKYLHIENDEYFFANTREFPLFCSSHGIDILRAPTGSRPDGSLVMSTALQVGTTARLAYGDPTTIIESAWQEGNRLFHLSPEAILVFSCAGRKAFWGDAEIGKETEPYQLAAPTFGFYTSGELLRTDGYVNQHNVTQVIASFREGPAPAVEERDLTRFNRGHVKVSMITRLAAFISVTTQELEAANRKLSEMAVTDELTGVGNRNAYFVRMQEIQSRIDAGQGSFAAAVIDINGLKQINDTYGHACGDKAITDAAECLIHAFGRENLYRVGGDEFICILEYGTDADMQRGFRLLDEAVAEVNHRERSYVVSLRLSKGCSVFKPGMDKEYRSVTKRADDAMYSNKAEYYRTNGIDRRRSRVNNNI